MACPITVLKIPEIKYRRMDLALGKLDPWFSGEGQMFGLAVRPPAEVPHSLLEVPEFDSQLWILMSISAHAGLLRCSCDDGSGAWVPHLGSEPADGSACCLKNLIKK